MSRSPVDAWAQVPPPAPPPATPRPVEDLVFLLDVDNTLLDNDRIVADLHAHLEAGFGAACAQRYWTIFEALRTEIGYADYLGALQRYRVEADLGGPEEQRLLWMSGFLLDYPFADRLMPRALELVARLGRWGRTVILSDGDVVFQPRKVQRSGLRDAVQGRVLIYVHKELRLAALQRHYPAHHYVMVDDKLRILAAMKDALGDRLTTVFVRQGHYALEAAHRAGFPDADLAVERIGDLADRDGASWRRGPCTVPEVAGAAPVPDTPLAADTPGLPDHPDHPDPPDAPRATQETR